MPIFIGIILFITLILLGISHRDEVNWLIILEMTSRFFIWICFGSISFFCLNGIAPPSQEHIEYSLKGMLLPIISIGIFFTIHKSLQWWRTNL